MLDTQEEYTIDGNNFSTLAEFYDVVSLVLIPNAQWGRNLNAFNDILRGGFGTPKNGFQIRWINSHKSRQRLGYEETVRQLEKRLLQCHSTNRPSILSQLEDAKNGIGPTVFDWLVEIIRNHSVGGSEYEDNVELSFE